MHYEQLAQLPRDKTRISLGSLQGGSSLHAYQCQCASLATMLYSDATCMRLATWRAHMLRAPRLLTRPDLPCIRKYRDAHLQTRRIPVSPARTARSCRHVHER
eukprot:363254-Chlamydomonas_euryale.AAC.8